MFPVIWISNSAATLLLKVGGLDVPSKLEKLHAPEELRLFLRDGDLQPGPREVIDRLFDYEHRTAGQIMTLRRDVIVLDVSCPWNANIRLAES